MNMVLATVVLSGLNLELLKSWANGARMSECSLKPANKEV